MMKDAAERAILPRFRQLARHEIQEKAANEVVTIADRESEEILATALGKILPEAAIVGEEAADRDPAVLGRLDQELCWIIDPLDGTANFAGGSTPFGILVALAERGRPIAGWIYDPISGRFCSAADGQGLLIDGQPVRSRATGAHRAIAAVSSLFIEPARHAHLLERLQSGFTTVPIPRCAAEQYPRIILGVNDLTLFERTLPWDHAAGVLCLIEAGGRATRFDGTAYRVNDRRTGLVAAATPEIYDQAVSALGDFA